MPIYQKNTVQKLRKPVYFVKIIGWKAHFKNIGTSTGQINKKVLGSTPSARKKKEKKYRGTSICD